MLRKTRVADLGRPTALFLAVSVGYVALALIHTYPLVLHLDSHVPGEGLGDNVSFVWNTWWMREALSSSTRTFFDCPVILAPVGGSLVLHTHTALSALAGGTLLGGMSVVEAQNIVLIASLVLNGLTAFLLAHAVTGAKWPSAAAGALFLLTPPIAGRLMGHHNLVQAWPLVLACLALVKWWEAPSLPRTVALGCCAALVPYVDYYYTVFYLLFAAVYVATVVFGVDVSINANKGSTASIWLLTLAAAAFATAALIVITPTTQLRVGPTRLSLRTATNGLTAGWLLLAAAALSRWRWRPNLSWIGRHSPRETAMLLIAPALMTLVLVAPLLVAASELWRSGDYVSRVAGPRSGPPGVDLATLVLGPPHSGVSRRLVTDVYRSIGLDAMESSAWLGTMTIVLLAIGMRRLRGVRAFITWLVIGGVFAAWALGPYLTVATVNTGLILPQSAAQFVPLLNNARIPGRAMTMVALSAAVLAALTLASFGRAPRKPILLTATLVVFALLELIAAPLPLVELPKSNVYELLRADLGTSAVLTLPFGVRDGFGERGAFPHEALYEQTLHGHPLVGGFLARVPAQVWTWYDANEPFAALLRLSAGEAPAVLPSCDVVVAGLRSAGVSWIVVYTQHAQPPLLSFLRERMPLELVAHDGERLLYGVNESAVAPCIVRKTEGDVR